MQNADYLEAFEDHLVEEEKALELSKAMLAMLKSSSTFTRRILGI